MEFGEVWNNCALDNLKKMSLALSDQKNSASSKLPAHVQLCRRWVKKKGIGWTECDVTSAVHIVVLGQV